MNRLYWIIPLGVLCGLTVFFRYSEADLILTAAYGQDGVFASSKEGLGGLLYQITPMPALALFLTALLYLLASCFQKKLRRRNRLAFFYILCVLLGPGLIVNVILKDNFGRPRPRQVEAFGQAYEFLPVLTPGPHKNARSFPSGHASIAFVVLAPFFALYRQSAKLAFGFLVIGTLWGLLIGLTRVLQGGHWPSDVLWAGMIVYFTSFGLARAFGFLSDARAQNDAASP